MVMMLELFSRSLASSRSPGKHVLACSKSSPVRSLRAIGIIITRICRPANQRGCWTGSSMVPNDRPITVPIELQVAQHLREKAHRITPSSRVNASIGMEFHITESTTRAALARPLHRSVIPVIPQNPVVPQQAAVVKRESFAVVPIVLFKRRRRQSVARPGPRWRDNRRERWLFPRPLRK